MIWNSYCDWYIEFVKSRLYGEDESDKKVARAVLVKVLKDLLKLLHPAMPFITEEIWSYLPHSEDEFSEENKEGFLIKQTWPSRKDECEFAEETATMELVMEAIRAIRNMRAEADAAPSKKIRLIVLAAGKSAEQLRRGQRHIMTQANVSEIAYIDDKALLTEDVLSGVITGAELFIAMDELVDYNAEAERLAKEQKKLVGEVERIEKKLSNEGFVSKAPENVINGEKEKLAKYREMLFKVNDSIENVKKKLER